MFSDNPGIQFSILDNNQKASKSYSTVRFQNNSGDQFIDQFRKIKG